MAGMKEVPAVPRHFRLGTIGDRQEGRRGLDSDVRKNPMH